MLDLEKRNGIMRFRWNCDEMEESKLNFLEVWAIEECASKKHDRYPTRWMIRFSKTSITTSLPIICDLLHVFRIAFRVSFFFLLRQSQMTTIRAEGTTQESDERNPCGNR
jgi:hypothetical protein